MVWEGSACSKPHFQFCGCLTSQSSSPYPGRRRTRGCGAQWFSPHPAASLPSAASGAALILLPLFASRCVRGGRRRRRRVGREEESGAAWNSGRRAAGAARESCSRGRPPHPLPHAARCRQNCTAAAPARRGTLLELLLVSALFFSARFEV